MQQLVQDFRCGLRKTHLEGMFLNKRLFMLEGARALGSKQPQKEWMSEPQPEELNDVSISTLSDDDDYEVLQLLKDEVDECLTGSRIVELTAVVQKVRLEMERMCSGGNIDQEYPSQEVKAKEETMRIQAVCRKFVAVGLLKDVMQFASYDPKVYQRLRSESLCLLAQVSSGDQSVSRSFQEGGYFGRARIILSESVVTATELEAILSTFINLVAEQPGLVGELMSSKCLSILHEHFLNVSARLDHLSNLRGDELVRLYYENREMFCLENIYCMLWLMRNCLEKSGDLPRLADVTEMISHVHHYKVLATGVAQIEQLLSINNRSSMLLDGALPEEISHHWAWCLYHYISEESRNSHKMTQKLRHLRSLINLGSLNYLLPYSRQADTSESPSNRTYGYNPNGNAAPVLSLVSLILEHSLANERKDLTVVDEILGLVGGDSEQGQPSQILEVDSCTYREMFELS